MQFFYSLNVKHVIFCGQRKKCKKCVPKKYFLTCSCRFLHHNYLFKFEFFQCIYTGEASSKNFKKQSISKIVLTLHFSNKWFQLISRILQILCLQPQIYISFSQWIVNFFFSQQVRTIFKTKHKNLFIIYVHQLPQAPFLHAATHAFTTNCIFFRTFSQNSFGFCMQHIF